MTDLGDSDRVKLSDRTVMDLDSINVIEALAADDKEAAFMTISRYSGRHDQLAVTIAATAALRVTSHRTAADELANFRRYCLEEEANR
jgi:hypothetical protein